jgi:hypothetical protein
MIVALGTLPFLATLWLLAVLGAAILEESGARIAAALKGNSMPRPTLDTRAARIRNRTNAPFASRASVEWRAAA